MTDIDHVNIFAVEFPNRQGIRVGLRGCPAIVDYRGPNKIYLDGNMLDGQELKYVQMLMRERQAREHDDLRQLFDRGEAPGSFEHFSVMSVQYNETPQGIVARDSDCTIRIFDGRESFQKYIQDLEKRGKVDVTVDNTLSFTEYRDQELMPDLFAGAEPNGKINRRLQEAVAAGTHLDGW